jgi:hypothetical protein
MTDTSGNRVPAASGGRGRALSPGARLCAFALLAVLLFVCAREIGHRLGPIGTSHARSFVTPGGGQSGGMNMSAGAGGRAGRPGTAR